MIILSNYALQTVRKIITESPDSLCAEHARALAYKWLLEFEHGLLSLTDEQAMILKNII